MLQTLSIRDFVIVDALELEFDDGFTVFSGETGAGKSILIDALALVLGERGDAGVVREGRPRADLAATFTADADTIAWLAANDMADGDGALLLRRTIDAGGRSKAWINGTSATLAQLRELGDRLVDIHGQHAHQLLLRAGAQRALLDAQGGNAAALADVGDAWRAWRALIVQRERFETDARALEQEREQLAWQVAELEALAPKPDEWVEIGDEHRRLAHAAALLEGAQASVDALSEGEAAIGSQLSTIIHRLQALAAIDPALSAALASLEPARIEITEAARTLNDYLSRLDLDPRRLAAVEARIEALHTAGRKLRVAPETLPDELDQRRTRLATLQEGSDLVALRAREAEAATRYRTAAAALTKRRTTIASQLSTAVTDAMQTLNMTGGRFEVAVLPGEAAAHGAEDVEFRGASRRDAARHRPRRIGRRTRAHQPRHLGDRERGDQRADADLRRGRQRYRRRGRGSRRAIAAAARRDASGAVRDPPAAGRGAGQRAFRGPETRRRGARRGARIDAHREGRRRDARRRGRADAGRHRDHDDDAQAREGIAGGGVIAHPGRLTRPATTRRHRHPYADQAKFLPAKSQLTIFQNASMYFGRAFR
jgi:DNA repair protein RecN (Recombination protein N)